MNRPDFPNHELSNHNDKTSLSRIESKTPPYQDVLSILMSPQLNIVNELF